MQNICTNIFLSITILTYALLGSAYATSPKTKPLPIENVQTEPLQLPPLKFLTHPPNVYATQILDSLLELWQAPRYMQKAYVTLRIDANGQVLTCKLPCRIFMNVKHTTPNLYEYY